MKDVLLKSYRFNLLYAKELLMDVDDKLMTQSAGPGLENHPAFTIGHLITASALMIKYLNGVYDISPEWDAIFRRKGPGDPRLPESNPKLYPSKKLLLSTLSKKHETLEQLIVSLKEENFREQINWRFDQHMPTLGDLLFFMCITHESMHLAQIAAWRRGVGLPSALAKL